HRHMPAPCSRIFPYTTLFRSIHGNCGLRKLHRPGPLIFEYQDADFSCSTEAKEPLKLTMNELRLDSSRIGQFQRFLRFGRTRKIDRKSTRLNSSHVSISYAVF